MSRQFRISVNLSRYFCMSRYSCTSIFLCMSRYSCLSRYFCMSRQFRISVNLSRFLRVNVNLSMLLCLSRQFCTSMFLGAIFPVVIFSYIRIFFFEILKWFLLFLFKISKAFNCTFFLLCTFSARAIFYGGFFPLVHRLDISTFWDALGSHLCVCVPLSVNFHYAFIRLCFSLSLCPPVFCSIFSLSSPHLLPVFSFLLIRAIFAFVFLSAIIFICSE